MRNLIILSIFLFSVSAYSQLRMDNNGNVGIGTTSPVEQFQIGDRWTFHDGGSKLIGYNYNWNGTLSRDEYLHFGVVSAINLDEYGNIRFQVATAGSAGDQIIWKNPLKIQNDGRLFFDLTSDNIQDIYMTEGAKIYPSGCSNGSLGTSNNYWYATHTKYLYRWQHGVRDLTLKSTAKSNAIKDNAIQILNGLNATAFSSNNNSKSA